MKLTDFVNPNYNKNSNIINELSSKFDLSNIIKQRQEMVIHFLNELSDNFYIDPNEKLQVNYLPLKITKSKNMLNLKQNIMRIISDKIVNSSNKEKIITLSIKEAMKILQNYNLLPNEISLNKNNSITFNGNAYISSELEGKIKSNITTYVI